MLRSEFMKKSIRGVLSAGLVVATGYLFLSGKVSRTNSCAEADTCGKCRQSDSCNLKKSRYGK
jgi:hypothetical protein